MDVRAAIEYDKGSVPTARNLPLLTNDERHEIGICYKQHGQEAAIELGKSLVAGQTKMDRIEQWRDFCHSFPDNGFLYCARGGLRSHIVQDWIREETGIEYPLVEGGYKVMRQYLLDELETSLDPKQSELVILCGKTGVGKTLAIDKLKHCSIDLEGLARHRGSSFGSFPGAEQPSQIDFENSVSIEFLKLLDAGGAGNDHPIPILLEDESKRIGNVGLPHILVERMKSSENGLVVIEESTESRVDVLVEDYVIDLQRRFIKLHGVDQGVTSHQDYLLGSLKRIYNRLGGDRYQNIKQIMEAAFLEHETSGDLTLYRVWISTLLEQYYDKSYDYQFENREEKVIFRGCRDDVVQWANTQYCV